MQTLLPEMLNEVIRRLVDALHPLRIYLFGSHAYGTPDRGSDLDLMIVVPDVEESPRELARRGRRSLTGMGFPVDILVFTLSEVNKWANVRCNLVHTVIQKGRLIYAA